VLPEGAWTSQSNDESSSGIYGTQNIYDLPIRLGSAWFISEKRTLLATSITSFVRQGKHLAVT